MIRLSSVLLAIFAGVLLFLQPCRADDATMEQLQLTKQNYATWRAHILPKEKDLGWQQIPWLTTFQDGILDADQRELPLLFWTMNGHPLGCT